MNDYLLPDKAYNILKWVGLIACPALATFIGVVGKSWGWELTPEIVTTINAFGIFIGAVIGASQLSVMGDDRNE